MMPKVILEKADIVKLINEAYNGAEIVSGLDDKTEIIIRVVDFKPATLPPVVVQHTLPPPMQKIRENTIPGGAMGKRRNNLPKY